MAWDRRPRGHWLWRARPCGIVLAVPGRGVVAVRSAGAVGVGLVITSLVLPDWQGVGGWAQVVADHVRPAARALSEEAVAVVLIAAALLLLVFGVLGKALDLKDKRAAEAIAVQGEIADALLREPALLGFPITPTARVPLWRGSPVTVKVVGQVPSDQLRKAALRAAERGASDLLVRVRIKSRIGVGRARRTA